MAAFIPFIEKTKEIGLACISLVSEHKVFNFVVDTGSNCSHIDEKDLEKLELCKTRTIKEVPTEGLNGTLLNNKKSEIIFRSGILGFKHDFYVTSLDKLKQDIKRMADVEINGILGTDFLLQNNCHIDFKKFRLHLS